MKARILVPSDCRSKQSGFFPRPFIRCKITDNRLLLKYGLP
ncbi:hypothetical protein M111_4481 [Bacteroides fragilis str. 3986T(B)10]|nr:hypothetical protein M111_4481 [Bacteroides fragilis str. 3986T(B)10]